MRLAAVLLLLLGCPASHRAAGDLDGDGLLGRHDLCPGQPESPNGWLDDDGCPDELARLRVTVLRSGAPVSGVTVGLPGAPPTQTDGSGHAVFLELLPVPDGVYLSVQQPGQPALDVPASLVPGENTLTVDLETPP